MEWIGQPFEPDFLGKENLGGERRLAAATGIAPADELVILNDVMDVRWIEEQDGS